MLGIEVVCFDADSEFYRIPTRGGELKRFAEQLMEELSGTVYTHNPWGEYGHIDHILCHQIAQSASDKPILFSDMAQEVNWLPIKRWGSGWKFVSDCEIDHDLYGRVKAIYDARGCWTWSQPPIEKCTVYSC